MEMVKGEATVVIVSHNAAILREICDRVVCLDKGNISLLSSDVNEVIQTKKWKIIIQYKRL